MIDPLLVMVCLLNQMKRDCWLGRGPDDVANCLWRPEVGVLKGEGEAGSLLIRAVVNPSRRYRYVNLSILLLLATNHNPTFNLEILIQRAVPETDVFSYWRILAGAIYGAGRQRSLSSLSGYGVGNYRGTCETQEDKQKCNHDSFSQAILPMGRLSISPCIESSFCPCRGQKSGML